MKYFTSDTHFAHPFVAALRVFIRPEYQEHSANDLRNMVRDPSSDLMWEQCVNTEEHDVLVLANINEVTMLVVCFVLNETKLTGNGKGTLCPNKSNSSLADLPRVFTAPHPIPYEPRACVLYCK